MKDELAICEPDDPNAVIVVTTNLVAQELGISLTALQRWVGRNKSFKPQRSIGRYLLWSRADIEALKEARALTRSRRGRPAKSKKKAG